MKLSMDLGRDSYDIVIKAGSLGRLGMLAHLNRRVLLVSDSGVPQKYVNTLMRQCPQGHCHILPQGESTKSIENWQSIQLQMLRAGFDRHDLVIALGGGVVGDVAGFAAASYMRGIDWVQVPTTTMAQIDSSVGGKVAVNLDGVKNAVGAFHQPRLVVADPNTLQSLPPRHYANGLAEALKTALVGCSELLPMLEADDAHQNIERIIYLCLQYKKSIVERDPREGGARRLLNFGHTIGHAIEAACGPDGLLHGECVALGMLPMIENRSLLRRTRAIMRKLGLPLKHPATPEALMHFIALDKKRDGELYSIVRVKTAGQGYLENVNYEELRLMVEGDDS